MKDWHISDGKFVFPSRAKGKFKSRGADTKPPQKGPSFEQAERKLQPKPPQGARGKPR